MDFGIYPPEINSGRIYAGPGAGPMLAAAQAWQSVADELYATISEYHSAVSELAEGAWSGPSSAAMSAAAGSYVEWLNATAARAEQAGAHEAAFASTVPPPEIAANRGLLALRADTRAAVSDAPSGIIPWRDSCADDVSGLRRGKHGRRIEGATELDPNRHCRSRSAPDRAANTVAECGHGSGAGGSKQRGKHIEKDGNWRDGRTVDGRTAGCRERSAERRAGAARRGHRGCPSQGRRGIACATDRDTGVAAAIRDIAAQRAAGLLSEQEYAEQKKILLEISFGPYISRRSTARCGPRCRSR
jgi:hypothetical protein